MHEWMNVDKAANSSNSTCSHFTFLLENGAAYTAARPCTLWKKSSALQVKHAKRLQEMDTRDTTRTRHSKEQDGKHSKLLEATRI